MATSTEPQDSAEAASGFKPYIPDQVNMKEFTWSAVALGTLLGLVFAASSLYLVLKVGMTVSASIPVAVLAITLFRALSKAFGLQQATILENNIVQTSGSAGESIAFGVGVTMPALLLLGYSLDLPRIMVVSILGGILGILAMIPLRRAFIVKMHGRPGQPGTLLYPEGTACAQVLISGEKGGTTGQTVFIGFGIGFLHKFVTEGMSLLKETVAIPFAFINKAAVFAQAMASELLGVGYIIGLRTSAVMMAGAVLGYLVIIPTIYFIGEHAPNAVPPGNIPIKEMSVGQIRNNYLLFIGAGCVATAGILSMLKTLPMIIRGVVSGLSGVGGEAGGPLRRTENDMPMSVVFGGSLGLIGCLAVFLTAEIGVVAAMAGALMVVLFGFLFVTVSARLTGEIGSSSNPISGMTTATLMLTCLIFLMLGWQSSAYRLLALSIAAVVCIASSNGGTTAQSLKTGFLVGGTPKYMQYAILIGALVSALMIGGTLIVFNESRAVVTTKAVNIPAFVLTKAEVDRLKETQLDKDKNKTYKIWRTEDKTLTVADEKVGFQPRPEVEQVVRSWPGIYRVDPETNSLVPDERTQAEGFPTFILTKPEVDRLGETVVHEGKKYMVWHTKHDNLTAEDEKTGYTPRPEVQKLAERRAIYFVDPDTGKLAALKDNTIMGQLEERDDGTYVKREFDAPKTQVMGIVINGVLKGDLNWSMIAIGAMIALTLELCGVSALAFAVGVYVPIQYSTPIFLGGVVRWAVDRYLAKQAQAEAQADLEAAVAAAGDDPAARMRAEAEAKAQAEIDAIRKSETSGGVLLASGLIAGGSLAGVLLGFLAFSDDLPDDLRQWEHRTAKVTIAQPLNEAAEAAALDQLGWAGKKLTRNQKDRIGETAFELLAENFAKVGSGEIWIDKSESSPGTRLKLPDNKAEVIKSRGPILPFKVSRGTRLKLPGNKGDFVAPEEMTLVHVAALQLGLADKSILSQNEQERADKLTSEIIRLSGNEPFKWVIVPKGAKIKLPEGKGEFTAPEDTALKDVAAQYLGRERKASKVFYKNNETPKPEDAKKGYVKLKLPAEAELRPGSPPPWPMLPAGAELSLPASDWPAWAGFGVLTAILLAVGTGYVLAAPREEVATAANGPPENGAS